MRDNLEYLSAGGWEMKDALEWVERHGRVTITSKKPPESDPEFHKVFISDDHKGHKIGTLDIPNHLSVKATLCKGCKAICVYLFMRKKVYSLDYLKGMVAFKEAKLKNPPSKVVADNYRHTIACLKREIKARGRQMKWQT